MFSAFTTYSPIRSEVGSPSRDRSNDAGSRTGSQSPTLSVASGVSSSSAVSNGVKSKFIRDLKLEVEMRDDRIRELEQTYEELERKAAFSQGEMTCKLTDQQIVVARMEQKQKELQEVIENQSKQLTEVLSSVAQYQSIQDMMKQMMQRCNELEQQKAAQEERERAREAAEKAAAERAAVEAMVAEKVAAAERQAEEDLKASAEEAAALPTAAAPEEVHVLMVPVAVTAQPQPSVHQLADRRNVNVQQSRQQAMSAAQRKKDCSIM